MNCHVDIETVELFSRGKLEDPLLSEFEAHYLVCRECQDEVAAWDSYVAAVRGGTRNYRDAVPFWRRPFIRRVMPSAPHFALPLAIAAVIVCIAVLPYQPPARQSQTLQLESLRGTSMVAVGSSSARLTLQLNVRGLEGYPIYKSEVVTSSGSTVWSGQVAANGDSAAAQLDRPLSPGTYWVRVYGSSDRKDLLREYGLTIE